MAYATDRVILFDRNMLPLDEIGPDEIFSRVRTEEINGEHSLVLVTTRRLQEGWRALTVDGTGKWREWVVNEIDEEHASGRHALGTYHLVWSLQYDLTMTYTHTHTEIGYGNMPKSAGQVAMVVCQGSSWAAGHECDAPNVPDGSGAVFIYESAWSKLSKAVECMECEVDTDIRVEAIADPDFDLTTPFLVTRLLNLRAHIGNQTALRRFDWNEDLTSIKRIPDPGPYYCRVVPLGKRKDAKPEYADDDKTTFDWPLDITEETGTKENPGPYYIEDPEAAIAFRRMNSAGTWVYPTKAVNYDENDPELLLSVAQEDLHNHTRPGVTYEADVLQFAQAGMNVQGVALGDEVQIVDYGFNPDAGLRIQGRVIKIEVDELSPETTTKLTIGQLRDELTDTINHALSSLNTSISSTSSTVTHMSTSDYIDELIDRINAEINAGGGYTYLVPGEGLVVYDKAVSDPLIGNEAESVVQIKDGAIRIANSRKAQFSGIDDWNWKSVFQSGLIATEVLNATNIITGLIQDANHKIDSTTGNYWDLDGSTLVVRDGSILANLITAGKIQSKNGRVYFDLDNNELACNRIVDTAYHTSVYAKIWSADSTSYGSGTGGLSISNGTDETILTSGNSSSSAKARLYNTKGLIINAANTTYRSGGIYLKPTGEISISAYEEPSNYSNIGHISPATNFIALDKNAGVTINASNTLNLVGWPTNITGYPVNMVSMQVSDFKSRVVTTDDYGKRLLYCYEMPSPMFGDIGEGVTDENGECVVDIDDIFYETIAERVEYQVFLQKESSGDIWVESKHPNFFVVKGSPNSKFAWELKIKQSGYETTRLEDADNNPDAMRTEAFEPSDLYEILDQELIMAEEEAGMLYETA